MSHRASLVRAAWLASAAVGFVGLACGFERTSAQEPARGATRFNQAPARGGVRLASQRRPETRVAIDWPEPDKERAWRYVVLHHSAAPSGDVDSIDALHRARTDREGRPWLGIGYHFVIGNGRGMGDGDVEPTFRWMEQLHGAHAGDTQHNEQGIGVCLIGDFEQNPPTEKQTAAAQQLIAELRQRYGIPRSHVLRHQDLKATECPGKQLPFAALVGDESAARTSSRNLNPRGGMRRGY